MALSPCAETQCDGPALVIAQSADFAERSGTMKRIRLAINPGLDTGRLAEQFRSHGRLHIPDFLVTEDAERLFVHLRRHSGWTLVFNQGEKLFELDRAAQGALSEEQKQQLDLAVYQSARSGFQFRFENIRISDGKADRTQSPDLLARFAELLSGPPVLDLLRTITGAEDIAYADAQATAYGPGHFLTAHDDAVTGKKRRAAYVFNLTPRWNADWGGLLLFHGAYGHVERALVPAFNALNIFAVPSLHSVSMVTPFAANRRYAVTGWLRSGEQPE